MTVLQSSSHLIWQIAGMKNIKQRPFVLLACVIIIFLFQINFYRFCVDINWVDIINELLLDGKKLYVDIIEFSPPFTLYFYLPGVAFAKALGIPSEYGNVLQILVYLWASLSLSYLILKKTLHEDFKNLPFIGVIILAIFLILPATNIGQRDYFGSMLALPMLACIASRLSGSPPSFMQALLSGIFAGICVCIKPNFILFFLFPGLWLWYSRGLYQAFLSLEAWIVLFALGIYFLVITLYFQIYLNQILPVFTQIYVTIYGDILHIFLMTALYSLLLVSLLCHRSFSTQKPILIILWLAAFGGLLSNIIQSKGYFYHEIPFMNFYLLALVFTLESHIDKSEPEFSLIMWLRKNLVFVTPFFIIRLSLILLVSLYLCLAGNTKLPHIKRDLSAYGAKPKMMQIAVQWYGVQMVNEYHGQWVGSEAGVWLTYYCLLMLERNDIDSNETAKFESLIAYERNVTLRDIQSQKPDVIFIGEYEENIQTLGDGLSKFWQKLWLSRLEFQQAMSDYELGEFDHGVSIYFRKLNVSHDSMSLMTQCLSCPK